MGLRMNKIYDSIVIGSGYGGMLAAYKMAKAGQKVLIIERGRILEKRRIQA